jgi:ABC-type glycerol-3-phosphate transport system substrate-binding protein
VTDYTRPATWDDVKQLARLLNEAGVEYALVGGYAIAAHGFNRFSEDIVILVNPSAENSQRWVVALEQLPDHATRDLLSNPDVFASDTRYALRINDEFTIDVMPSIAGHSWVEMRQHIESIDLDGVPLRL